MIVKVIICRHHGVCKNSLNGIEPSIQKPNEANAFVLINSIPLLMDSMRKILGIPCNNITWCIISNDNLPILLVGHSFYLYPLNKEWSTAIIWWLIGPNTYHKLYMIYPVVSQVCHLDQHHLHDEVVHWLLTWLWLQIFILHFLEPK